MVFIILGLFATKSKDVTNDVLETK